VGEIRIIIGVVASELLLLLPTIAYRISYNKNKKLSIHLGLLKHKLQVSTTTAQLQKASISGLPAIGSLIG
jgi:hypothetical protein